MKVDFLYQIFKPGEEVFLKQKQRIPSVTSLVKILWALLMEEGGKTRKPNGWTYISFYESLPKLFFFKLRLRSVWRKNKEEEV